MVLIFLYNTYIHIFCYHLVLSSYHICNPIIYHECIYALLYSYIHIYSFLYSYLFISFIHFYHDLAILVLSIFLSCRLLLIHIFIYVPIIYVHVLIPMFCHLLLISIVLIIYAFLSCVPSMFHHIPFGMSII